MNKRHPLDELFSQHLRDASAPVPEDMWSRIARARQQKRRRLIVVWSSVGSATLTLIAAILLYVGTPNLGSFPLQTAADGTQSGNEAPTAQLPSTTTPDIANSITDQNDAFTASDIAEETDFLQGDAISTNEQRTRSRNRRFQDRLRARGNRRAPGIDTAEPVDHPSAQIATLEDASETTTTISAPAEAEPTPQTNRIAGPHQRQRLAVVEALPEKSIALAKQEEIKLFANHAPRCADFAAPFFRLDLEMLGGPAYAHQTLQAKTSESLAHLRLREKSEAAGVSYSGGFRLAASSNVGLSLRTGVMYTQINDRFTYDVGSRMDVSVIFGPNGEIVGRDTTYSEAYQETTRNTLRFVEVPLLLGYERQWGKLRVGVNAGAYLNVLFATEGAIYSPATEEPINFGQQGDRDVLPIFERQISAAWYAGMSLAYNLHSRYSLIAEPYFKTYPQALSSSAYDLQQNYWMTGMQLGLRMRL